MSINDIKYIKTHCSSNPKYIVSHRSIPIMLNSLGENFLKSLYQLSQIVPNCLPSKRDPYRCKIPFILPIQCIQYI